MVGIFLIAGALNGLNPAVIQLLDADAPTLVHTPSGDTLEIVSEVSEDVLEELIDLGDDAAAADLTSAQELLHEMAAWKLDVNSADEDALQSLPGVARTDAARIIEYRRRYGRFRSLTELHRTGVSSSTVEDILPFLTIRKPLSVKAELVQRWSRRMTQVRGHATETTGSRYLGTPDALLTRFRMSVGSRITFGGTLEKDAGEPMRSIIGHDFAAGYGVLSDLGPFDRIVVGDYSASLGEGLAFGQSSSMGSGPQTWRMREVLRPHSSSREFGYFRGLAARTKAVFGIQVAVAFSRRRIDARFDSTEGAWSFSSSGLHRTETERARNKDARETVLGWILSYGDSRLRAGLSGSQTRREAREKTIAENGSLSGFVTWWGAHASFSSELAVRDSVLAASGGIALEPARATQFWIHWLCASPGGSAPHSSIAVDGSGVARQERQWQAGFRLQPSEKWRWTVSARRMRKPSHLLEGESSFMASTLQLKPRQWIAMRLRLTDHRSEGLGACTTGSRTFRCSSTARRQSLRLQVDYEHSRTLRHRFQIEVSRGTRPTEGQDAVTDSRHRPDARIQVHHDGVLLYKDIRWRPSRFLQVDARILFFEVSDYAARIYAFENDLLYSFSAPVFSGRGRRSYVILRLAPHRTLTLQLKYSVSSYEDVRSLGSGLDETVEPRRKDIRLQLRWKIG